MKSNLRASLLGIILGGICGLGGILSGIYFGIIKPLQENGGANKLPLPVIITSIILTAVFVMYLGFMILSKINKKKNKPTEW